MEKDNQMKNAKMSLIISKVYGGYKLIKEADRGDNGVIKFLVECIHCKRRFERDKGSIIRNSNGCITCSNKMPNRINTDEEGEITEETAARLLCGYLIELTKKARLFDKIADLIESDRGE